MYRIGLIQFHPARNPKQFIASCSVTFLTEDGQPFVTVHDFVLGRSEWEKDEHSRGKLYCSVPASFVKSYDRGQMRTEVIRSIEFPPSIWHEVSKAIIDAYQREHPEPLTPSYYTDQREAEE